MVIVWVFSLAFFAILAMLSDQFVFLVIVSGGGRVML